MSYYQEEMCRTLTQRTGDWLQSQAWPRTTAVIVLTISLLAMYYSANVLFSFGIEYLPLRLAISTFCGYLVYLLLLGLWMHCFTAVEAKSLLTQKAKMKNTEVAGDSKFDELLNSQTKNAIHESGRHAESLVGFVIVICVLGLLFICCHFVYHAPWYLAQLLVHSGKIRHRIAPNASITASLVLPLWQSWPAAVMLLLHSAAIGLALNVLFEKRGLFANG